MPARPEQGRTRRRAGGVLLIVVLLVFVMSVLGLGLMNLADREALQAVAVQADAQAFWLAEAGLAEVRAAVSLPAYRLPFNHWRIGFTVGPGTVALSGTLPTGSYSVNIVDDPAWDNALHRAKRYMVTSTGTTRGGPQHTVRMRADIDTFARYAWATNWEQTSRGNDINFGLEDILGSPSRVGSEIFYSNDQFNVYEYGGQHPVFNAQLRTGHDSIRYYTDSSGRNYVDQVPPPEDMDPDTGIFRGGIKFNASALDFGSEVDHIAASASHADLSLPAGDYEVQFEDTQVITTKMRIRYRTERGDRTRSPQSNRVPIGTPQTNSITGGDGFIIYLEQGNAFVHGVVGGQAAVLSEQSIYVTDGVVYTSKSGSANDDTGRNHANWTTGPAASEALALLARLKVGINYDQPVGRDANLHAAVMAMQPPDSYDTANFNPGFGTLDRNDNLRKNGYKPYINLYGSISQYRRGVVGHRIGYYQGVPEWGGYWKNYAYDVRFSGTPPPGMPYSAYAFGAWEDVP